MFTVHPIVKQFAKIVGAAFCTGVGIQLVLLVVTLPVSYMLNKYIYHNIIMRWIVAIVTAHVAPIVLIYILFFSNRITYMAYFPVIRADSLLSTEGWFAWLGYIVNAVFEPLLWNATDKQYEGAIGSILLPAEQSGSALSVPEEFFEEAQKAAAIRDPTRWAAEMARLALLPEAARLMQQPIKPPGMPN